MERKENVRYGTDCKQAKALSSCSRIKTLLRSDGDAVFHRTRRQTSRRPSDSSREMKTADARKPRIKLKDFFVFFLRGMQSCKTSSEVGVKDSSVRKCSVAFCLNGLSCFLLRCVLPFHFSGWVLSFCVVRQSNMLNDGKRWGNNRERLYLLRDPQQTKFNWRLLT